MKYTEEELGIAKSVDLTEVAKALGYTVVRRGRNHTIREMDSLIIYDRRSWCRWSRRGQEKEGGGSQIDFLMIFTGCTFSEAVNWLLDFAGYIQEPMSQKRKGLKHIAPKKEKREPKAFCLPPPADNNDRLYAYLMSDRGISKESIDWFISQGLIYESKPYHNIVFKGLDKDGQCRFASMRGTYDRQGAVFKGDVEGNDKTYGFHVASQKSHSVYVFEGAIDLMSFVDLFKEREENLIALGMVSDAPLETFLKEHPQITEIIFCLDNDKPGRTATRELMKKYYERGYDVTEGRIPTEMKDMNEWLLHCKSKVQDGMKK